MFNRHEGHTWVLNTFPWKYQGKNLQSKQKLNTLLHLFLERLYELVNLIHLTRGEFLWKVEGIYVP